jgi:hypothetical protein
MNGKTTAPHSREDRATLRELARRVKEAAADPRMAERRRHWTEHNDLKSAEPVIWLSPEGAWRELVPDASLLCAGEDAREAERELRMRLYRYAHFDDASVIEARWDVPKAIETSPWGIEAEWTYSREAQGARTFKPVLHGPEDLTRLRMPMVSHDEKETERRLTAAHDAFDGILEVRAVGRRTVHIHLMSLFTSWHGLAETMEDMAMRPRLIHDAMELLTVAHQGILRQLEAQDLLSLNNDNTYHASGGTGWTAELPAPGFDGKHVRPADMWGSAQSQELAGVSPAMHREFALEYEKRLVAPFARVGYGCCENLTHKLDDVLAIPRIRRVSISPYADVDVCAPKLGGRCIFSWKPHPAHLVGAFDEIKIRDYIGHTVKVCRASGCHLEMILKDTHTCENRPERFDRWAEMARESIAAYW